MTSSRPSLARTSTGAALLFILAAGCVRSAPGSRFASSPKEQLTDAQVLAQLVKLTEGIQEAIRLGDKHAIAKVSTDDLTLINRDGNVYDRHAFLDDLPPPREGYDLRFKVVDPRVIRNGDTALLTYITDEYLTIFGHDVSTAYRTHLLFVRVDKAWKLKLYTYWEKPATPVRVAVSAAGLAPLAGTYEVVPGKWTHRVRVEGDKLMLERGTKPTVEMVPMAGNRFSLPGVEAEYYFDCDTDGRATALVFRRNWIDLRLRRADAPAS